MVYFQLENSFWDAVFFLYNGIDYGEYDAVKISGVWLTKKFFRLGFFDNFGKISINPRKKLSFRRFFDYNTPEILTASYSP